MKSPFIDRQSLTAGGNCEVPPRRSDVVVSDPDGRPRMVTPADRATAAEREISESWEQVATAGDFERLVRWVLAVGAKHSWPLDEEWVRHTFGDLISNT
ncbi:MAG: hypothetical protein M3O70_27735 [Actinomycetota bacterium]|nr:hypothetical protein [Actinomycetota bacterium]